MPVSIGIDGQTGDRSAPTVLNTVYGRTMFWDGRAPSLEGQAQGPGPEPDRDGQADVQADHRPAADDPGLPASSSRRSSAPTSPSTAWPRRSRPSSAWRRSRATRSTTSTRPATTRPSPTARSAGWSSSGCGSTPDDDFKTDAVLQKAKCTLCHAGFNFTDEQFHNLGIGWDETSKKVRRPGPLGRRALSARKYDGSMGAFKTPTVRDAEQTAPYMHDGSLATLEEVIDHYDKGGTPNPALDPGHEEAQPHAAGEGRRHRVHEGARQARRRSWMSSADAAPRPRRQDRRSASGPGDPEQEGRRGLPSVAGALIEPRSSVNDPSTKIPRPGRSPIQRAAGFFAAPSPPGAGTPAAALFPRIEGTCPACEGRDTIGMSLRKVSGRIGGPGRADSSCFPHSTRD